MNLYLNGKNMHCPASGIRGTVYPVVYGKILNPLLTHLRCDLVCRYNFPPLEGCICVCLGITINLKSTVVLKPDYFLCVHLT